MWECDGTDVPKDKIDVQPSHPCRHIGTAIISCDFNTVSLLPVSNIVFFMKQQFIHLLNTLPCNIIICHSQKKAEISNHCELMMMLHYGVFSKSVNKYKYIINTIQ